MERIMHFTPLHPDLGVEVHGFDVQAGGTADEIAALRAAFDAHDMLLFRGAGRISPERHTQITSWFGPPGPVDNAGNGQFVSVLDNAEEAGSFMLPFHSDLTYTDCRSRRSACTPSRCPSGRRPPASSAIVPPGRGWARRTRRGWRRCICGICTCRRCPA
ncbi:MAG: TauD/TfdA family dioxygenase [Sphingomonadales bacterium]|nr:TauD/TfdA family dioxygenase [Sphingomonadales bacterium]